MGRSLRKRFNCIIIILWMLILGCEEQVGIIVTPVVEFSITPFSVPDRINLRKPIWYEMASRVTHPQGPDAIDSVIAAFYESDMNQIIYQLPLYDDGGAMHEGDGDVVARDCIFTNRFNPRLANFPVGTVWVEISAVDKEGRVRKTSKFSILAVENSPPVLLSISAPDTFFSGTAPILFSASVQDSDGIADVAAVILRGRPFGQSAVVFEASLPLMDVNTGLFGQLFDSTLAAERMGLYRLSFQAVDLSGDSSAILNHSLFIENRPPQLFNPQLPTIFQRPNSQQQSDTLQVKISVNDPQGLVDVDSVYFQSRKPDGQLSGNGTKFLLFDDGDPVHGDSHPDDGRYSLVISITSDNQTGQFIFIFHGRDKVGHLSTTVMDTVEIVP